MTSFYSREELAGLGLAQYGENVLISRNASIYGAAGIRLGSNVRIDDFCVLSGKISLGNYVHIAAGCMLFGGSAGIEFDDYTTISSRGAVYAVSDDYSGATMTNPMIPEKYKNVSELPVYIGKHVIIGTGSTVLPGVRIEEGCAFGAMSLIDKSCGSWGIYYGVPAIRRKERSRELLSLCNEFESEGRK